MTFARPEWFWLLLVLPVLLLARLWSQRRARLTVAQFAAPRLRDTLLSGVSLGRSWSIFLLQLLALAGLILAFCGPRWGQEKRERREKGRDVIIAIDVSRSMLANDVQPDRLTRCRLAAQDLLGLLAGDRVGLIAFAGHAYLQAPLTDDHDAVIESILSLDVTSIPRGGSELGKALKLAVDTFAKSSARNHGLILFSDGGEPDPELARAAKQAVDEHVVVLTVGVGTEGGSFIPDPDPDRAGDWVRDAEGNVVKTKLESGLLQELARTTGGRFFKLGATTVSRDFVRELLSTLEQREGTEQEDFKPIERFYWPLIAAMVALVMSWMIRPAPKAAPRGAAAFGALLLFAAPSPAPAVEPVLGKMWGFFAPKIAEGDARQALEAHDFTAAAERYDALLAEKPALSRRAPLSYARGVAAHELKDFDQAVSSFSDALESDDADLQGRAHTGLGGSLYEQGVKLMAKNPQSTVKAWRDSLRHFEAALALDPGNKDLEENRDFVRKLLDELEQQIEQQRQQQRQQQGSKGQQGQKGQKGQKGKKGQQGQQGQQGKDGQEGQEGQKPGGQQGDQGDEDEGGRNGKKPSDKGEEGENGDKEGKGDAVPKGKIEAGSPGQQSDQQDAAQQAEAGEGERSEATGFSLNEARAFLRAYADDQKSARLRQMRQDPARGKDW